MITSISRFFETALKTPEQDSTQARDARLRLASAALLLELCSADNHVDAEEIRVLKRLLHEQFNLGVDELEHLWELAQDEVNQATSLYQFTSLINEHYDHSAKTRLLTCMWEVAYADGRLDRYEEYTIRKVADLLYLSHKDFIQTKLAVRPDSQQEG